MKVIRKITKKQDQTVNSKDAAKERLHLVLMQDRANVSADFLDLMKQEINQQVEKLKYDERFKGEYMMVNLHEWELTERAKKQGWEEGKIEGAEQTKTC